MANSNCNLRLQDQKYTEAEYLFKTIEMAKSDEEYDDICIASSPPNSASEIADIDNDLFSWKVVKRRKPQRRHTVSHSGAPPAPPSTPTSLSAAEFTTNATVNNFDDNSRGFDAINTYNHENITSTRYNNGANQHRANGCDDDDDSNESRRFNSLLFILNYTPKFKKKLKEQRRLDSELAAIFNDITITGKSIHSGSGKLNASSSALLTSANVPLKLAPERGVCYASRTIRKYDINSKTFKIHRNPKEFFRDPHYEDEDSISAPEFDAKTDEDELYKINRNRRHYCCKTQRILSMQRRKRYVHEKRVEDVTAEFDSNMSFNGLQHKLDFHERHRHQLVDDVQEQNQHLVDYFNGNVKSDMTTYLEPKQSSSNATAYDLAATANTSATLWWSTNQSAAFNGIGNGP